MINGVMAGLLLLLMTVWGWYALNRLWQEGIAESAKDGLEAAVAMGLSVIPPAYSRCRVAMGHLDGVPVRVEWRDGILGPCTVVARPGQVQVYAGLADGAALAEALKPAA